MTPNRCQIMAMRCSEQQFSHNKLLEWSGVEWSKKKKKVKKKKKKKDTKHLQFQGKKNKKKNTSQRNITYKWQLKRKKNIRNQINV